MPVSFCQYHYELVCSKCTMTDMYYYPHNSILSVLIAESTIVCKN